MNLGRALIRAVRQAGGCRSRRALSRRLLRISRGQRGRVEERASRRIGRRGRRRDGQRSGTDGKYQAGSEAFGDLIEGEGVDIERRRTVCEYVDDGLVEAEFAQNLRRHLRPAVLQDLRPQVCGIVLTGR